MEKARDGVKVRKRDGKTQRSETEKRRDCEIERWGDGQRDRGTKRLKDG